MRHCLSRKFRYFYDRLPKNTKQLADKNYQLLKRNPRHPSLHLKKVSRFWSVRIGIHYRAVAVEEKENIVWFWIGHHSEYDSIIGRRQ